MLNQKVEDREQALLPSEQVRIVYMQAPVSNMVAIVIAAVFYVLLQRDLGQLSAGTWSMLIVASSMSRFWLWSRYNKSPDSRDTRTWLNDYTSLSAVFGLVWGSIYLLVPAQAEPATISALSMLYFGVAAGAYAAFSMHLPLYFLYTAPSLLGFSYMLFGHNEMIHPTLIGAVWLFYLMFGLFARSANRSWRKLYLLKSHNASLVNRLREEVAQRNERVRQQTEQLNQVHHALQKSEEQLQNVVSGANLGYWDWQYQTGYHEVNDRWLEILGLSRGEIHNDITDWSDRLHPGDRDRMLAMVEQHIFNHRPYVVDYRLRHKDGHWVWIQGSGAVVEYDENGVPLRLCGIHQEISGRKNLEKQLKYQATHDPLTGLFNRGELWARLEAELNRAQRHQHTLAVFMVDIDHFKRINDTHGHHTGDRVLQGFARMLGNQLRKMDYCARYGGEEFIVILPETNQEQALGMAERLRKLAAGSDNLVEDLELKLTISIGIASYPEHGRSPAMLVDAADNALYRAKDNGRNRIESAMPVNEM